MLWMATIQLSLAVFWDILCIYVAGFFSYQHSHGPFQTQFQHFSWFVSFFSLGRLVVERSQELVVMFQVDVDDDETLFILWCFHLLAAVCLYYITIGLYLSSFLMLIFLARHLWSAATGRLSDAKTLCTRYLGMSLSQILWYVFQGQRKFQIRLPTTK